MRASLVAIAAVLLQLLAPGSQAASASTASSERSACASLSLAFFPSSVVPEEALDYDFDLVNCGTVTERLTVRLQPAGPCRFIPPSRNVYVLEPGQGFIISSLMIGPSCPGLYRLRGDVQFRGRTLDRAVALLEVRDASTG